MISETIDTASKITTDELNKWYRGTYIYEVANVTGWKRTSRFSTGTGSWLALHEFEGPFKNGTILSGLLGASEETKSVQRGARKIEVFPWKLVRAYGDVNASW